MNEALCVAAMRPLRGRAATEAGRASGWAPPSPHAALRASQADDGFTIGNFSYINAARVKVIKVTINGVGVAVTGNQAPALYAVHLVDAADRHFGRDHLFKRALILAKAW